MDGRTEIRLGDIIVRPNACQIEKPSGTVRIEPKAMAVLVELLNSNGNVKSREALFEAVWPGLFITDDVLTRCIGQLRKALDDHDRQSRVIETIPKKGYRLTLASAAQTSDGPRKTIIVLPFQNFGAAGDINFADALTELLTARIADAKNLRVISRTTAMSLQSKQCPVTEISELTGADYVVEGSAIPTQGKLQVVVQLINAKADEHIWVKEFLRDLDDIFTLRNDIARTIADDVHLKLGVDRRGPSGAAALGHDVLREYLKARYAIARRTPNELRAALFSLERVVAEAPDYAPGWASRGEVAFMLALYGYLSPVEAQKICDDYSGRALTLDPSLGIALACRGQSRFSFHHDFNRAKDDLIAALDQAPNYSIAMLALANVCAASLSFSEAEGWMRQALLADPLDVGINMNVGDHLILRRDYDRAVEALRQTLELAPTHRPSQLRLAWALSLSGAAQKARAVLKDAGPNGDHDWQWCEYDALISAAEGDQEATRAAYQSLQSMRPVTPAWSRARAAAAAGDFDAAERALEEAVAGLSPSAPFARATPAFAALHGRPRFEAVAPRP